MEEAERTAEAILADAERRAQGLLEQAEARAEAKCADRVRSVRRECERLAKLRSDIASGLLEVSKAAERDARRLLNSENHLDAGAEEESADVNGRPAPSIGVEAPEGMLRRAVGRSGYVMFVTGVVCGFGLALLLRLNNAEVVPADLSVEVIEPSQQVSPSNDEPMSVDSPQSQPETPVPANALQGALPSVSERAEQADSANVLGRTRLSSSGQPDGLRVTLSATEECWVSVQVDGDEAWDRLMAPDQTIEIHAETQAVVRIGDAGALSMLINDRPVKPLGADGQVVNLRITPANYQTFLLDAPGPPSPNRTGASAASNASGLRLTLQAKEECWVKVQLDEADGWERLMYPGQTIEVDALEQAVVRIGNAAALSLRINDRPAKPFGAPGQVATLHITQANYQTFLATVPGGR